MCMKSINITTTFYDADLSRFNSSVQFGNIVDKIKVEHTEGGEYRIKELTIATNICAFNSTEDPNLNKKYDILWTFGCGLDIVDGKYPVIAKDLLDVSKNKIKRIEKILCRDFCCQIFKFTIRDYVIERTGDYFLKVFIREHNTEGLWILQSLNIINVYE